HSVGGMHRELVFARPGQNRLEVPGHALEHPLFWKRRVLAIRATPQARVVQLDDDGSVLRVDHEGRSRVSVTLEVIVDVRGNEALRPSHAVELQAGRAPHAAARAICANDPPSAEFACTLWGL